MTLQKPTIYLYHLITLMKKQQIIGCLVFFRRHSELTLRKSEATSLARATGFNQMQVGAFCEKLNIVTSKNDILPARIYYVSKTGISTVHKPGKIICQKGIKQVGKHTSLEKGKTITVVCVMGAAGSYVYPAFIFSCKRMINVLFKGSTVGPKQFCSPSGWIDVSIFRQWLFQFQNHVDQ